MNQAGLNPRVVGLAPSATLALSELSAELVAQGRDIYRFGFGQSPFPVPEIVVAALRKHAHEKDYLPVLGLPALRQEVATFLNRFGQPQACAQGVMVGPGSKELMFLLQLCFAGKVLL
ncbi:MAG: aspartate aminotransferase, partial [Myxococcota bacterium]|nr:aspartate aminotransferase [Myxococcota bacterium]